MHPLLARRGRVAFSAVLWLLVGGLLAALLAGEPGLTWPAAAAVALPLALLYSFVCASAWYVARSAPLTSSGVPRVLVTAAGAALISSAAWLIAARAWSEALALWAGLRAPFSELSGTIFGFGVLIYLLSLAASYAIAASEHAQDAERRALEVQVLSREAELRTLRAQIDPHFLFNSLHSISALTSADPAGARRMCLLLADFLRQTLKLGAEEQIPLARELELAGKYLEIEQVRYGERLGVEIDGDAAGTCLVPSLLLQPIVENAVTHGVAHLLDGGTVRIRASRTPSHLLVDVESPCDPGRPQRQGAGLGLANVQSRLKALYGTEASVDAREDGQRWRVRITMPAIAGAGADARAGTPRLVRDG